MRSPNWPCQDISGSSKRPATFANPHPVSRYDHATRIEDAALPVYTIIVALYREGRIAPRLISALRRLDYPAAKLDIKLVLEADDRETMMALRRNPLPGNVEIIVAPPGQPRTKPRALNIAPPTRPRTFHRRL